MTTSLTNASSGAPSGPIPDTNASRSRPVLKLATLSRFQENAESYDDFLDANEDINLSYSRFSQISGISISRGPSAGDTNESGSPFVKRVQNLLRNITIEHAEGALFKPPSSRPRSAASSISNRRKNTGLLKDRESPFLDPLPVPPVPKGFLNHQKIRSQNRPSGSIFDPLPEPSSRDVEHTPERPIHQRNASVKVSLTPAQRFEKRPGTRLTNALENFQFSTLVGRGAFANVYKGINLRTNQEVAIKQIALEKDQDVMELMGEIDLLKILKHPNIVKYHGFVKTSTSLNVFLEFCSGGSLRQLYKRRGRGIPELEVIPYVKLILQGLNYLHEQGVVHRDVKAANVLVTEHGEIKLADFGVATKVSSQHHSVVGTPNWMAPETVLGGEGLCTASDIWSLGATIIELFTTHPPYHELNAMATLHAIGTDEHPPIPKGISPLAKGFLLECFQKQPSLRVTAKLLLKHKWLAPSHPAAHKPLRVISNTVQANKASNDMKSFNSYSEANEENWDNDFGEFKPLQLKNQVSASNLKVEERDMQTESTLSTRLPTSKSELLRRFTENNDDLDFDHDSSKLLLNNNEEDGAGDEEEENLDPFLDLEIEDFDTSDVEVQNKMEYLVNRFTHKVDLIYTGDDQVVAALIRVTGKMLHLVKKYPHSHEVLIRDHGILSILELLENAQELPKQQKLWYLALSVLNYIFANNTAHFESFCLLGGIPVVTQFRGITYDLPVRQQVVKFVRHFLKSERALSMFVSSGGLRVLSKFVEEDFDLTPEFPLVSIDCIHDILSKDLTRYKSDVCRILSRYGVIFWFVVLLNRLTKFESQNYTKITAVQADEAVEKILIIVRSFSQSEARVRVNISSTDLFKLMIKVYPALTFKRQLTLLKFFKSVSCIPELLKQLYNADILEFMIDLMLQYTTSSEHYKEVINIICPTVYNCCYLNHPREHLIVKLGAVPLLKQLSRMNLPFRQFVLPILCELVYCDEEVRTVLKKHDILSVYFALLVDPYWQANALDSVLHWSQQNPEYIVLNTPKALDCLVGGFMLPKASNLESTLDNYLKVITNNKEVREIMVRDSIITNILLKLNVHKKNPVVQLSLLRILKSLLAHAKGVDSLRTLTVLENVSTTLQSLKAHQSSVLVQELVLETSELMGL